MRAETYAYTYSKTGCTVAVSLFHYRPTSQGTPNPTKPPHKLLHSVSVSLEHADNGSSLELRQNYAKYLLITIDSPSSTRLKLPPEAKMAGVDYKPFDFRLFVEMKGERMDDAEAAEMAAKTMPHRLTPYERTPAGCPRPPKNGVWNPILGSGPLRPWMVPRECLLADWVVSALRILSKLPFKVPGAIAGTDLKERGGYGFNQKGTVQSRSGRSSAKTAGGTGQTMYDAEGRIMTLDNCEMRGDLPEDAKRPAGLITESNFLIQPGDRGLWFNSFYHGAHTSDPTEAKAFSQVWIDSFANFDRDDKNPHTRTLELRRCGESFAAYKLKRETAPEVVLAPPSSKGKKSKVSGEKKRAETTAQRLQRLAKKAQEDDARGVAAAAAQKAQEDAARGVAAAQKAQEDAARGVAAAAAQKAQEDAAKDAAASTPKSAADRAAYYKRLAQEAADEVAVDKAAKEAAEAAAAKKAVDDAAAEELRAAEEEAAALPPAERAARFLQLAREAEEKAAKEVAGGDPSAVERNADEEDALEEQREPEKDAAELKAEGDELGAPTLAVDQSVVDEVATLRKANEELGRVNAAKLANGNPNGKSRHVLEVGTSAQYALNTYTVSQRFYGDSAEWADADDKLLPFLHAQIEHIYNRKRQRKASEQEAERERASKVPKN